MPVFEDPEDPQDPTPDTDSIAARAWFEKFIKDHGIESWGDVDDGYRAWLQQINLGLRGDDAYNAALAMLGWDNEDAWPINPNNQNDSTTDGEDDDDAPPSAPPSSQFDPNAPLVAPFNQSFTPPSPTGIADAPVFDAPEYTPPPAFDGPDFQAPTVADMMAEPGYEFRESRGLGAIKNWLAHQGRYNSGATPKALTDYAQDYASNEYSNVYGRALDTHRTVYGDAANEYAINAQSQHMYPYEQAYRAALDTFAPKMTEWSTRAGATQRSNEFDYSNAWQRYMFDYDKYRNQKLDTFNMMSNYLGS